MNCIACPVTGANLILPQTHFVRGAFLFGRNFSPNLLWTRDVSNFDCLTLVLRIHYFHSSPKAILNTKSKRFVRNDGKFMPQISCNVKFFESTNMNKQYSQSALKQCWRKVSCSTINIWKLKSRFRTLKRIEFPIARATI